MEQKIPGLFLLSNPALGGDYAKVHGKPQDVIKSFELQSLQLSDDQAQEMVLTESIKTVETTLQPEQSLDTNTEKEEAVGSEFDNGVVQETETISPTEESLEGSVSSLEGSQTKISVSKLHQILDENTQISPEIERNVPEQILKRTLEQVAEKTTEQPTEQPIEQPTEQLTEQPTEQLTEQPAEQPTEKTTEKTTEQFTEQITEQTLRHTLDVASIIANLSNEDAPDAIDIALAGGAPTAYSSDEEMTKENNESDGGGSSNSSDSDTSSSSDNDSDSDSDSNEDTVDKNYVDLSGDEASEPLRTKNEVLDEPAPQLPDGFELTAEMAIESFGKLVQIVERTAIISAFVSGEFRILQESSILCFADRSVLGPLYDIIGRVQSPLCSVKFNTEEEASRFASRKGETVYYIVPASKFLFTNTLKSMKGSDASNWNDEEIAEEEQEYSDDEKEQAAKLPNKKRKRKPRAVIEDSNNAQNTQGSFGRRMKRGQNSDIQNRALPSISRYSNNAYEPMKRDQSTSSAANIPNIYQQGFVPGYNPYQLNSMMMMPGGVNMLPHYPMPPTNSNMQPPQMPMPMHMPMQMPMQMPMAYVQNMNGQYSKPESHDAQENLDYDEN